MNFCLGLIEKFYGPVHSGTYNKSEGFNKNVLIFLRRIFYYFSLMYGYFLDASVLLSQGHLHSDRAYKGFSRSR